MENSKVEQRFLSHIDKTETCWLWTGAKNKNGYGHFGFNGKTIDSHRFAYLKYKGEIPLNCVVRHSCDVRNCCNPEHLSIGTQSDNMQDCVKRGRYRNGRNKLTIEIVNQIRNEFKNNVPRNELAAKFKISKSHCNSILNFSKWKET